MAVKSQFTLSRDAFDVILTVIGTLLPEGHILPKSMYEAEKAGGGYALRGAHPDRH